MSDTSFTARVTTIAAVWLNQLNKWAFWGRRPNFATTTGSANAQILTLETGSLYAAGSEASGDTFCFIAGFTNAAAMTLQVLPPAGTNTARAVQLNKAALIGGEVIAGQPYQVTRAGVTWQITSLSATVFASTLLQAATAAALRTLIGVVASPLTTKGDLWGFSTVDARIAVGADGKVLTASASAADGTGAAWSDVPLPRSYLAGNGLANNAGDTTNDIDIAVGACRSLANTDNIVSASALTKQLDVAWAVGTNQGMRATGVAIADTTYHIFVIKRPDTGVVDVAADTSVTGANIAANTNAAYTEKRRIGSIVRAAGAIRAFVQTGDLVQWKTVATDTSTIGTAATLRTIGVPVGIKVLARISAQIGNSGTAAMDGMQHWDPDLSSTVPGTIVNQFRVFVNSAVAASNVIPYLEVGTNTSAQIYNKATSSAFDTYTLQTGAYVDRRGRDD